MPAKGHRTLIRDRLLRRSRSDENGCWLWTGALDKDGYGKAIVATDGDWNRRHHVRAHRLAYETLVGPIPTGLQLDHLCATPACINPAHLEPVTTRENVLRGRGAAAVNARKQVCDHGHLLTEENTYRYTHRGREWRGCRECRRRTDREAKQRKRDRAKDLEDALARFIREES